MQIAKVTMTSLEMVEYINTERRAKAEREGAAFPSKGHSELRHDHFMAKVPEVLGVAAPNFRGGYTGADGTNRPCYIFPKREACLMAMSYSYELQAKVFDHMTALEQKLLEGAPQPTLAAPTEETVQLNVTITKGMRKALKTAAAHQEVTVNTLVAQAITEALAPKELGRLDGRIEQEFTAAFRLAELVGCDRTVAAISANNHVMKLTGTNVLATIGQGRSVTEGGAKYVNPSELMPGVVGRDMNQMLMNAGLQSKIDGRWTPTKAGAKYSHVSGLGTYTYQVKWSKDVLSLINIPARLFGRA